MRLWSPDNKKQTLYNSNCGYVKHAAHTLINETD